MALDNVRTTLKKWRRTLSDRKNASKQCRSYSSTDEQIQFPDDTWRTGCLLFQRDSAQILRVPQGFRGERGLVVASSKLLEVIKEGKQALAKFRATNPNVLLDLTDADLKGADLRGMNLRRALLVGARLSRADLSGAVLSEADLTRANLKAATLARADLRRANLFKAMLTEANAEEADFGRSNLNSAEFTKANFTRASFIEADFNKAQINEANVLGTDFSLARFAGTHAAHLICGWTRWSHCDLSQVIGLETASHQGPSSIGLDTWLKSRGQIPPEFLRGSGLPDDFIAALQTIPREAVTCFLRFSHEDLSFAQRLAEALRAIGVVCWLDEMPNAECAEPPLEAQFDSQQPHKVILLASRSSLTSPWIEAEVGRLLEREQHWKRDVGQEIKLLFPLTLDGFLFGGDAKGKHDKAVAARVIADFNGWRRNDTKFDEVFPKVIAALGVEPRKSEAKSEASRSPFAWFSRKKDEDE